MPKKTKKEKLLALYRKRIRLLEQKSQIIIEKSPITKSEKIELPTKLENEEIIPTSQENLISKYFFLDLKKSLILIVLIIALEIGLYFVRIIK
jgi:hypothetical protein